MTSLLLLALLGAEAKEKMLVLEVKPADESVKALAQQVQEQVLTELTQDGRFQVLSTADLQTMLGLERQKQLLGCSEGGESCLTELTDALGAPWVVSGTLGRAEAQLRLDLKVLSSAKNAVAARAGKVCSQATVFTTVTEVVEALLGQLKGQTAEPTKGVAQSTVALLTNPDITLEVKRAALKRAAEGQSELTSLVEVVKPEAARDALCVEFRNRVLGLPTKVTARDSYGDPVAASVEVLGVSLGATPFDGLVPFCVRGLTVRRGDGVTEERPLTLSRTQKNELDVRFPGRPIRWALSALGEVTPYSATFGLALDSPVGAGLQLDYWGKVFHFSLAAKASSLYRDPSEALGLFGGRAAIWLPGGDVFFGAGWAFGNGPRLHVAFDLGAWTLFLPAARLTLALNVGDRFVWSFATALVYDLWAKVSIIDSRRSFDQAQYVLVNLSTTVGVAF